VPFCTNCGTNTGEGASYCSHCGAKQPGAQSGWNSPGPDLLAGMSNRTAAILCYIPVFGVIPAIIFLASHKYRLNARVRFDAFQALYLFVAWLVVSTAAPILLLTSLPGSGGELHVVGLFKAAAFICWIYLLIKAAQEQQVRLPIIGDLAARSATEQL